MLGLREHAAGDSRPLPRDPMSCSRSSSIWDSLDSPATGNWQRGEAICAAGTAGAKGSYSLVAAYFKSLTGVA